MALKIVKKSNYTFETIRELLKTNGGSLSVESPVRLDCEFDDFGEEYAIYAKEFYLKDDKVVARCAQCLAESDLYNPVFDEEYILNPLTVEKVKNEIYSALMTSGSDEVFKLIFHHEYFNVMKSTLNWSEFRQSSNVLTSMVGNPNIPIDIKDSINRIVDELSQKHIPLYKRLDYPSLCLERAKSMVLTFDEIKAFSNHKIDKIKQAFFENPFISKEVKALAVVTDKEIKEKYERTPSNVVITTRDGSDAYDSWARLLRRKEFDKVDDMTIGDVFPVDFERWTDHHGHEVFITKSFYGNQEFQDLPDRKAQYDIISRCVGKLTQNNQGKTYCLIHGSDIEPDEDKWLNSGIISEYSKKKVITAIFHHLGPEGHHATRKELDPYFIPGLHLPFSDLEYRMEMHSLLDGYLVKDHDLQKSIQHFSLKSEHQKPKYSGMHK